MFHHGQVATWHVEGEPCRGVGNVRKEEFLSSPLLVEEAPQLSLSGATPTCALVWSNEKLIYVVHALIKRVMLQTQTEWNTWSSWTCQVTCGSGSEVRTRTCQDTERATTTNNSNCMLMSNENPTETRECSSIPQCPGNVPMTTKFKGTCSLNGTV